MKECKTIDVEKIASYITSKGDYEQVFSSIFERIGKDVSGRLIAKYPEMRPMDGRAVIRETLAEAPAFGADVPVDWVAFSFKGYYFWDLHVGVVFDTGKWPVTYEVGFHLRDNIYAEMKPKLEQIDWESAVGLVPRYTFTEPVREHKYNDPPKEFDLSGVEAQVGEIVDRAVRYYKVAAPVFLNSPNA
jgi:hypothetical protein